MFKIIIFFALGILLLILIKKLIFLFTKNLTYQYILYFLTVVFFISLIFVFRESKLHNTKGLYLPPEFDGESVIPGKVFNEKD
tara:strand:- start:220 stop:468 length:249 start_codon:yes stop_codon:yes gene_type:complete